MPEIQLTRTYTPLFTTETNEPSPWLDCTWASGLMLANKATRGRYQNSLAERKALKLAANTNKLGASLQDLALGIKNRYNWTLPTNVISLASLEIRLRRGDGAVSQGLYSTFLGTLYSRWDRNFAIQGSSSGHATYVQGHDPTGLQELDSECKLASVWWVDPLALETDSYNGEWMPWGLYTKYLASIGWISVATAEQGSIR